MKAIKMLSERIEEEIDDARWYAKNALKYKAEHRAMADVLYTISTEEMKHMQMLHGAVTELIDQYRREQGEPPSDMMAIYNYLHERHIEKAAEVSALQALYRE